MGARRAGRFVAGGIMATRDGNQRSKASPDREREIALEQLVQEVGEAVHLSALHGAKVLTLLTQPTSHAVAARNWVGQKIPAYCTSSGRALLFDHGPDALFELFGPESFPPQGPNAPADVGELERRILRSRQLGYATADEESKPGLVAAAPIRDFSGGVVAAINVSAPKFRLGTRLDPTGELVRAAAGRLSEGLGAPVRPDALGWQCPNEIDLQ